MDLNKKLEAILFWKGEPMSRKKLSEILGKGQTEINEAIGELKASLASRGIVLQEKDNEITLGTNPEMSKMIEELQKEELRKELSKASLETLSIVLYKEGVSRSEIDYIRGVNSSFTLRLLSIRGLVERIPDPKDNRRYIYKPSFELLSYMGVTKREELPDFAEVSESIKNAAKELVEAEQEDREQNG